MLKAQHRAAVFSVILAITANTVFCQSPEAMWDKLKEKDSDIVSAKFEFNKDFDDFRSGKELIPNDYEKSWTLVYSPPNTALIPDAVGREHGVPSQFEINATQCIYYQKANRITISQPQDLQSTIVGDCLNDLVSAGRGVTKGFKYSDMKFNRTASGWNIQFINSYVTQSYLVNDDGDVVEAGMFNPDTKVRIVSKYSDFKKTSNIDYPFSIDIECFINDQSKCKISYRLNSVELNSVAAGDASFPVGFPLAMVQDNRFDKMLFYYAKDQLPDDEQVARLAQSPKLLLQNNAALLNSGSDH